jgi:hypothetical protein
MHSGLHLEVIQNIDKFPRAERTVCSLGLRGRGWGTLNQQNDLLVSCGFNIKVLIPPITGMLCVLPKSICLFIWLIMDINVILVFVAQPFIFKSLIFHPYVFNWCIARYWNLLMACSPVCVCLCVGVTFPHKCNYNVERKALIPIY